MRTFSTILLAATLLATSAFAAESEMIRSITVTGQAERKVVPDQAHVNVNLNSLDKSLSVAKAMHDRKLEKLMGIVKKTGIEEKKVATQHSNTQPVYNYVNGTNVFRGYRVQTMLDITVEDTTKLGDLMEAIGAAEFEKGASTEWGNLMSVHYTLSNPDKVRDDLLTAAIANAKSKAENMAKASGADIGRVWQINESGTMGYNPPPMPMMARAEMAAGGMAMDKAAMIPPAGEQQIQSTVTVTYELK